MALNILKQTFIMLILMIIGIFCSKTKLIRTETNKDLSKFVLQVVNPIMIFMSYQREMNSKLVKNLLLTFGLSVLAFAVMIPLAYLAIRNKEGRETAIERFSAIYSNCGFMGIPLIDAMFGKEGVFYLTAFITVFNFIVWTHGIILISGEKNFRQVIKVFYSPTIIAIVLGIVTFFLQIKLPEIPYKALAYIEEINTPVAMIVSGVTMAGTEIKSLVKDKGVYRTCAVKLIVIPVVLSVLLSLLDIDEKVRLTVIIASSAPPATMCTLQCLRYGKNSLYASEIFTAGTILSVFTLPIITQFTEFLTKNFH